MVEKYLTPEQNTCAARIFLNTFGLTLENVSNVNEFLKIKIFDKNMNEVGKLQFDNGKVIMSANYNNSVLDANFDIAKISIFVDTESNNEFSEQWLSKITFHVQKQDSVKLSGEFLIKCSTDSEFGVTCLCSSLINCESLEKEKITLNILKDYSIFTLNIISEESHEVIDIRTCSLLHTIKNGKYDDKNHSYPYKRYARISNAAERGEDKNKLHVFLDEKEYNNQLAFRNEFSLKVEDQESKEALLQKGLLMQQLDPSMFKKIEELKKMLLIGEVSLLDNLISVCYDRYTDEELTALLGVKRQKINYQDGANSLVNSYYGIGVSNCLFPLEAQKRLLKK